MTDQRFGLSANVIAKIHGVLAQHPHVQRAVIYGSRAKGNYKPGSDIDLTLFAATGQEISHWELADILDEVDDLLLPYTLDLSYFEALNHAKLKEHIERVGKVFYERGDAVEDQGVDMKAGWHTEKLGEVCSFLNRGISPKYVEGGGMCVLNQKCIRDHEVNFDLARRHDPSVKRVSAERLVQIGDVLINSTGTGTLGRVAQLREAPIEPTTVDSHVTIARPISGKFFSDFFGYMLIFIEEAIKEAGEGCGGQTELARSVLAEKFSVSYPSSHSEQHRIVAILDEAFDGIATAKANAEKNLQNARALFESHLQWVFTVRGEGWIAKPLGEIGKVCMCKRILKEQTTSEGDIPFYKIGTFGKEADAFIPIKIYSEFRKKYSFPNKGDVLISAAGTIGRRVVYDGEDAYFQDSNIVWIANDQTQILNHYLYHFYGACEWNSTRGATISRLYNDNLRQIVAVFPKSHHEQRRIAAQLDALFQETQRLASLYQQKLTALDALKKSLLHQAFSGQL